MIRKVLFYTVAAGSMFGIGFGANRFLRPNEEIDEGTKKVEAVLAGSGSVKQGNPSEAVKDLKRLYAAIDGYRKMHNALPGPDELLQTERPVGGVQLIVEDFQNPDAGNKPRAEPRDPKSLLQYRMPVLGSKGPDGKRLEAFPKGGRRDVWVSSPFAAWKELDTKQDGSREWIHHGSYVVLFSDGKIETVKYADVIHYQHPEFPPGTCTTGFPGMGGVTKFHRISDCPKSKRHKDKLTFVD